jgi:hypothetical protein
MTQCVLLNNINPYPANVEYTVSSLIMPANGKWDLTRHLWSERFSQECHINLYPMVGMKLVFGRYKSHTYPPGLCIR